MLSCQCEIGHYRHRRLKLIILLFHSLFGVEFAPFLRSIDHMDPCGIPYDYDHDFLDRDQRTLVIEPFWPGRQLGKFMCRGKAKPLLVDGYEITANDLCLFV
jgi:hypothetical protein